MGEVMEDEEMVDSYLQQKFIEEEETEQPSAEIHNPTIINGEFLQEPETSMNQTVQLSNSVVFLSDIVENLPDANNTYGVIVTSKAMDEIENHGHKEKPNLESVVDAKDPVPEADVMDESKSNSGEKESHFESILDANNNACAFANVTDESKNNVDEKEPHSEVAGNAKDAADAEASAMDESKSNGDEKEPLLEPVLVVKNPVEADVMDESEGNCDEANAMNEGKSNGGVKETHVEPIDDAKKEATDANTVDESKRNGDEKELDFKHVVDADANAVNESKRNYDKKKSPIEYAGYAEDASTMNAMVESKENGDQTKKELHSEPLIDANNNADGSKENGDDDMDTASLSLVKAAALKIGDSDMKNIEKNGSEVTGALLSKEHSGKESVKQEFLVKEYQVSPKISYLCTHDNDDLSGTEEEQVAFVKELENFFEEKKMEFKPPKFYGKELNCLKLWRAVARLGGYDQVVAGKLWKQVGGNFNPPKTCTTVSWTFRGFYEKALLEYERSNMHGCDLRVPFASPADSISTENQVGDHQASGSGRVRSDAAGRATKGWHSQGFLGNGEADDRIVKDKTPISMPVQENRMETDGVLKGKKSFKLEPATRTVQTIAKPTKPRMETTVMDIGAPADWVKINIRKTKDCFEVYALVPGLLREEVRVQSDPAGRLVISGEPEKPDNPWGVTPFKKVVMLPSRIDPANTSAVVTLHGQLFVRAPFEQSNA